MVEERQFTAGQPGARATCYSDLAHAESMDAQDPRRGTPPSTDTRPLKVEATPQAVVVEWDDGHRSSYPHRYLRLECGCAGCVEEISGKRILDPAKVPQNVTFMDYMEIGNYGIQPLWSDGHHTGIYTYNRLRALCPCGRHEKSDDHP